MWGYVFDYCRCAFQSSRDLTIFCVDYFHSVVSKLQSFKSASTSFWI